MTLEYKISIKPSFVDKRGAITNVLEVPIEHVVFITSKKGSVRGNHYHKLETQYVYLIRGEILSYSKDVFDLEAPVQKLHVLPGDLIVTGPYCAHKHVYLKDSWFINLNTMPRKKLEGEDTFRFEM